MRIPLMTAKSHQNWLANPAIRIGIQLASVLVFLALWQWYGTQPKMFAVAPPTKVFPELLASIRSGEILQAASGTLATMLVGYALSVVLGLGVGLAIGLSAWGRNTLEPLVNAFYGAPTSMFIPLIGVYLGFEFPARVCLVVLWCIFAIIVNTISGIEATPRSLIEMARAFNASRWTVFRAVVLPSALPQIIVGLRMGLGRALRGAVAADILLEITNLGRFINDAGATFNMPRMLAGILFVVIFGVILMKLAKTAENWLLARLHY